MDTGAQRYGSEKSQNQLSGVFGARRSTLVLGGLGTGKTIFALQALVSAAREGQRVLFAGIGQSAEAVIALGDSFGWDLPKLQGERLLGIHTFEHAEELAQIGADVLCLAGNLGAERVALDCLNLAALPADTAEQTRQMLLVRDSLFEQGLTAIFTCNTDAPGLATQCAALMRSLVDCAVWLESRHDPGGLKRFLRVIRYRAAAPFPDWEFPFSITQGGIELSIPGVEAATNLVGPELQIEVDSVRKRLRTGLHALDRFLEMKQAELDFLLEKAAEQAPASGPQKTTSGGDPFRPGAQQM
jgi:circadian clock protein KaiC